jgi:hypothetical protein
MFQSMARSLDSNAVLISTLAVIRNLSFEVDSAELFDCYVFAYILYPYLFMTIVVIFFLFEITFVCFI